MCACKRKRDPTFFDFLNVSGSTHTYVHLHTCACACVNPREKRLHSRWIARKRGPKEGEEPDPKSGELRLFSRPGDACTVILWMKSATHTHTQTHTTDVRPPGWQSATRIHTEVWVSSLYFTFIYSACYCFYLQPANTANDKLQSPVGVRREHFDKSFPKISNLCPKMTNDSLKLTPTLIYFSQFSNLHPCFTWAAIHVRHVQQD